MDKERVIYIKIAKSYCRINEGLIALSFLLNLLLSLYYVYRQGVSSLASPRPWRNTMVTRYIL